MMKSVLFVWQADIDYDDIHVGSLINNENDMVGWVSDDNDRA